MKIVTYDKRTNVVLGVFPEIYHPEIDRKNGVIFHENGTFQRATSDEYDFLLVEDYVAVIPGDLITDSLREKDLSNSYDGFNLSDIADNIKKMGNEVVEEIRDLFSRRDDKDA